MADFKEMRLPLEISAWMVGGAMFNTRVFGVQNGDATRLGLWEFPQQKWDIPAGETLIANAPACKLFQLRARGRLYGFRVLDHLDYAATFDEGHFVATGTANVYQMVKTYTQDGDTFVRTIVKPIPGTCSVTNNGVPVVDPIDYSTGLATVTGVSDVSLLLWSGFFDVPVAFNDDWLQIGFNSNGTLLNWNNAGITELRRIDSSSGTPPPLVDPVLAPVPVLMLFGPNAGTVGVASANFLIVGANLIGPVVCTPALVTVAGTLAPTTRTLTSASPVASFNLTPSAAATGTVGITNNASIANPPAIPFTAAPAPAPPPPPTPPGPGPTFDAVSGRHTGTLSSGNDTIAAGKVRLSTAYVNRGSSVLQVVEFNVDTLTSAMKIGSPVNQFPIASAPSLGSTGVPFFAPDGSITIGFSPGSPNPTFAWSHNSRIGVGIWGGDTNVSQQRFWFWVDGVLAGHFISNGSFAQFPAYIAVDADTGQLTLLGDPSTWAHLAVYEAQAAADLTSGVVAAYQ